MEFKDIEIRINKPYPEIVGAVDDAYTVAVLKNLAFSRTGEINGVLQYIYQSVIADKSNKDIAEIFEEIGIVEMMHLDMLMHAISSFGGNPKYEDANRVPYSTNYVIYSPKLMDMLQHNIKAEQQAIESYGFAKTKINNQSLKNLIDRIIEDEQKHLEVFKQILNNVQFLSI